VSDPIVRSKLSSKLFFITRIVKTGKLWARKGRMKGRWKEERKVKEERDWK
jgi:hypothetical protein